MSLEVKIEALTAEVTALTQTIKSLLEIAASMPSNPLVGDLHRDADPKEETPVPKTKKKKADVKEAPLDVAPTVEELQALCMEIVRADRSLGAEVKETIAGFGGAKTIKRVPESDLIALKTLLEVIKDKA